MALYLELQLLSDVAVPRSNRSLGGAESLDFVPGRALWGAAASFAFESGVSSDDAFMLFHGGRLRFLDAVPTEDGARTYPTPKSWHQKKYGDETVNLCVPEQRAAIRGLQYESLSGGFRSADGREVQVERHHTLRTSVTATGRAGEGLLFGIDAIREGTRLHAVVEGDGEALESIRSLLVDKELRLGRSKSAELGLVSCKESNTEPTRLELFKKPTNRVFFLCCSRLALRNEGTGAPTFTPWPEAFGLPNSWRLDPNASFIRTTNYSPFNAKWKRPELERLVIDMGSVISFEGDEPIELDSVRSRVASGVGSYRGEGLGQVVAHPRWLTEGEVSLPKAQKQISRPTPTEPDDELFHWASRRRDERAAARRALRWAAERSSEFERFKVPPSQWGVLHGLAREARHRPDGQHWIKEQVSELVSKGVSKLSRGWGAGAGEERAGKALVALVEGGVEDLPIRLELLAGRCLRHAKEVE